MPHQQKITPEQKRRTWIWILIVLGITLLTFLFADVFTATLLTTAIYLPWLLFLLFKWKLRGFWISLILSSLVWFLLVIAGTIIFAVLIWNDIQSIQNELMDTTPKYLFYEADNRVLACYDLQSLLQPDAPTQKGPLLGALHQLSPAQTAELVQKRNAGQHGIVILTITKDAFLTLPEKLDYPLGEQPITIDKQTALHILEGGDAQPLLQKILGGYQDFPGITVSNDEVRSLLFFALIQKLLEQDPATLFRAVQQNKLTYYPDHLTIRIIKSIPPAYVEQLLLKKIAVPNVRTL